MSDPAQQSDSPHWQLVVDNGPDVGQAFAVSGESISLGRDLDNDIQLDDLNVSRHHARLTQQENGLFIEDLNTVNGTLVNDKPITHPQQLQAGDKINLGGVTLRMIGPGGILSQSRQETIQSLPVQSKPSLAPGLFIAGAVLALILLVLVIGVAVGWFISGDTGTAVVETATPDETVRLDVPRIVINRAPANNSQVTPNEAVTIQAVASASAGITRMELLVNGQPADRVESSLAEGTTSMTAAFQWTPDAPGPYTLEVRAYNQPGLANLQPIGTVLVVEPATATPTPQPTPSPTITPVPPTPTPTVTPAPPDTPTPAISPTPRLAQLTVDTPVLNVRAGPGTSYAVVGRLLADEQVEITGQANPGGGRWWQVRVAGVPGDSGWVTANPTFSSASNSEIVPDVAVAEPAASLPTLSPSSPPTPTPTATPPPLVTRAPAGRTLLIVSNRSLTNQPALLTLSGGKSVGGGQQIDVPAGQNRELVLEPDEYRALWSSPARPGGFVRGADFTAVPGKVRVMWIVPEEGRTGVELYDELVIREGGGPPPPPSPTATSTPAPAIEGYIAPPGQALLVAANRSLANNHAILTLVGGNFGGGEQITLNANTETPLGLVPGSYRALWSAPARGSFAAGRQFSVETGQVIISWIVPENGQVFMQFPGQSPIQVNN